jgi:hypothetical protein
MLATHCLNWISFDAEKGWFLHVMLAAGLVRFLDGPAYLLNL